jgi:hypothetical protein
LVQDKNMISKIKQANLIWGLANEETLKAFA